MGKSVIKDNNRVFYLTRLILLEIVFHPLPNVATHVIDTYLVRTILGNGMRTPVTVCSHTSYTVNIL